MNTYVTTAEIKTYLGVSGSSKDALIAMLNKMATDELNQMLSVRDLALHKVTGEVHDGLGATKLVLDDLNVRAIGDITDDGTAYTQTEDYDVDNYILHLEDSLSGDEREVTIDYVAGWDASGRATITVTTSGLAAAATITLGAVATDGFTITRGVDWTAAATDALEAAAIAAALDAKTGVRAFALGNVVYCIEDTNAQVTSRTIASSDSTRLALSASTLSALDFPESLRLANMLLVSGLMARRKNQKVKSYTIGTKSVTFTSDEDAAEFGRLIKPFQRASVFVI